MSAATSGGSLPLVLANEQATNRLAVDIAAMLAPGDWVTLSGDLGAGKTTFARAIIRRLAGDDRLEVPSPTFTLVQSYPLPRFPVVHADLYRVADPAEIDELGFEEAADGAAVLLEWPDRAGDRLPANRLDISFTLAPTLGLNTRNVAITGHGSFAARLQRQKIIRDFLDEAGFADAERRYLQGDASTRAYERLVLGKRSVILMNAPRQSDGPPIRNGLPYSAIAHLAEDVKPFVALARGLRARGLSAPEIYAADLAEGLLILEDLGCEGVVAGDPGVPIDERYAAAVDLLVALHGMELPTSLPVAPKVDYWLPSYDVDVFLVEVELALEWYFPSRGVALPGSARLEFGALWHQALDRAVSTRPTWVLRDFHSPNLLWLAERDGIARVGLLDFQDAQLGPPPYDVVSLLQDARVDVPEQLELNLLARYAKARHAADPHFKLAEFVEIYATMGAQRATKLLGIFSRLSRRDGKPQYLRHLPRVWRYLRRSLSHPSLTLLREWYDRHVPPPPTAP
jgi:tRNA threonylcarbamoyl adenosine modification protein YjeE